MIDTHCHILPGIDDGPVQLAGSIEMARAAVGAGITTVVATPHVRADFPQVKVDEIADRCAALAHALRQEGIDLELVPGGEVSVSWALEASDERLRLASYGQRGRCVLIETPSVGAPLLPLMLGEIAARGYQVVLAHPERSAEFQQDPDRLHQIIDQGVLLQVNADAITGNARRSPVARLAGRLSQSGRAAIIASDGHRAERWRPITALAEARAQLGRSLGEQAASVMLDHAPRALLDGESIPRLPVVEQRSRRWLRRS